MVKRNLAKSMFVLGIVLATVSFMPSTILSETGTLLYDYSAYQAYPLQCTEDPYLYVDVRNDKLISLYILTIEESSRLIAGTPIENISIVFSLVNISEYSGLVNVRSPGLYILFISTFNQSESTIEYDYLDFELMVSRKVPHQWVLGLSLVILVLAIFVWVNLFQKLSQMMKMTKIRSSVLINFSREISKG